jgi:hypothetical protein
MLDNLWFSDPTAHIFYEVLDPKKLTDPRAVGVYRQRLDASNPSSGLRFKRSERSPRL